ncbi:MAG: ArnT family glycosyltransferase [Planctomycetaceae bacterium]
MDVAQRNREPFDDTAILRIALHRPDPLLRVVGRARALQPLIAVLAVLPVLVVVQRGGLTDSGAVWGLRALDVLESQTPAEFLAPGRTERTRALSLQPPAASWLTAGVVRLVGTKRLQSALLVSLLAAAGCVWWTFRLFHRMVGARAGFWAAVLFASHGGVFSIAGSASPTAPALLLVLMTFNAWLRHLRARDALVTLPLLMAGIAMGLCVLTGGLMAFACLAVLLLHPAVGWLLEQFAARSAGRVQPLGRSVFAGAVLLMTAFCVSGWWFGVSGGGSGPPGYRVTTGSCAPGRRKQPTSNTAGCAPSRTG